MDIVNRNEPALASGAFLFDAPALAVTVYCRHRLAAPCGKSPANAIRGWCCGGARGRDRTLRLSVIRLRPRTFPRLVGPRRGCPTAPLIAAVAKSRDQGYWGLISVGRAMVEAAQQH